jgi:hypothetical protein
VSEMVDAGESEDKRVVGKGDWGYEVRGGEGGI